MGREKTHVSQQRRDSGAYWARAKSISRAFGFDGVTFCRCTPAAARLRNLYIFSPFFIAGTPSDARFEVVGKFFNVHRYNLYICDRDILFGDLFRRNGEGVRDAATLLV